jgi:hypothetical protein
MSKTYCVACNEEVETEEGGTTGLLLVAVPHERPRSMARCSGSGESVLAHRREPEAELTIYRM